MVDRTLAEESSRARQRWTQEGKAGEQQSWQTLDTAGQVRDAGSPEACSALWTCPLARACWTSCEMAEVLSFWAVMVMLICRRGAQGERKPLQCWSCNAHATRNPLPDDWQQTSRTPNHRCAWNRAQVKRVHLWLPLGRRTDKAPAVETKCSTRAAQPAACETHLEVGAIADLQQASILQQTAAAAAGVYQDAIGVCGVVCGGWGCC